MWDRERSDKQLSEPKIDGCHASIRAEPPALRYALPQIPASTRPLLRRAWPPPPQHWRALPHSAVNIPQLSPQANDMRRQVPRFLASRSLPLGKSHRLVVPSQACVGVGLDRTKVRSHLGRSRLVPGSNRRAAR